MKKALVIFCCLCGLYPAFTGAVRVPGLYEAETVVADQSASARQAALRACLRLALVKLTGEREVLRNAALAPLLNRPERFVREYRYKEVRTPPAPGAPPATELRLVVRFDEDSLNKSLRDSGVPVWGRERPSMLIWLVVEQDQARRFASSEETPEALALLRGRAQERGIFVMLPLLDLEDSAVLQPRDIWGGFEGPILAASARYEADVVLTGSVESLAEELWNGKWTMYQRGAARAEWRSETGFFDKALKQGVDGAIDRLAAEFAQAKVYTRLGEVQLVVNNVHSIGQYARVIDYLGSLSAINEVRVTEVREGEMTLALSVHGGERAVSQALSLGSVMELDLDSAGGNHYRLRP